MRSNQAGSVDKAPLPADLAAATIEYLDQLAYHQADLFYHEDGLGTSQIRRVYSRIVKIRMAYERREKDPQEVVEKLVMLRPTIAYAIGRTATKKRRPMQRFGTLLLDAIDAVKGSSKVNVALERFFWLCEALVAYHRFQAGEDE